MKVKELKEMEGGYDARAVQQALSQIENALVSLQDEAYSVEGGEREAILSAVEQAGQALEPLRQLSRRQASY